MNNTLKILGLLAIIAVAAVLGFIMVKRVSGEQGAAKVYERESKVLTEDDKAKMRAGWTYDVKAKVWYDENFRPVGKDAKPPAPK